MSSGFRVGRVAGIDVVVDWSLAVIFIVLMFSLGDGLFLYWRPDWSPLLRWSAALVATTLFFGSALAHELAHALVGRARGLQVKRITLFIFGEVAPLESEPPDWRAELWVALVGPLTSLALALALALGLALLGSFAAGVAAGLWLILIGWFLNNAAVASHRQLLARSSLENIPVAQVMRADFASVHPAMLIGELVDHLLLPGDQRAFPVLEDGRFVGLVCFQDIRQVPRAAWGNTPVRAIMTPAQALNGIPPGENAADAMLALGRHGVNQLPVVENGKVRGLVVREDLMKLLSVYSDPALAS